MQVLADPGQGVGDLDAQLAEEGGCTDAGELQELRRADGAGGEDELAPGDEPRPRGANADPGVDEAR